MGGKRKYDNAAARFRMQVDKVPGGHWIWTGPGTPRLRVNGLVVPARRFIMEQTGVEVPSYKLVIVTCGNDRCVAPKHLLVCDQAFAATRRRRS
jgi:hypothetical protein